MNNATVTVYRVFITFGWNNVSKMPPVVIYQSLRRFEVPLGCTSSFNSTNSISTQPRQAKHHQTMTCFLVGMGFVSWNALLGLCHTWPSPSQFSGSHRPSSSPKKNLPVQVKSLTPGKKPKKKSRVLIFGLIIGAKRGLLLFKEKLCA